jgi:hypothetical protein
MQQELLDLLDDNDGHMRRELALLVDRRHKIAHGESEGIGPKKTLELVAVARTVADWFVRVLNPDASRRRNRN